MLILDKQRAIERIVALSDAHARTALETTPPRGARPRVATYRPKGAPRGAEAVRVAAAAVRRRIRRDSGAPFPV
jgi:hypothetical protein